MLSKSKNERVGICLIVFMACTVLAGVWAVLAVPETALAKKPGGGGADGATQDIAVSVVIDDQSPAGVSSDGGGAYIDSKKDHVSAIVGRNQGQFLLATNTNNAEGGRTMELTLADRITDLNPPDAPEHLFDVMGTVTPIAVEIYTTRNSVEQGYVDLRAMAVGESADLALRIRLIVTDIQNHYDLNYGDVLFNPDSSHWDPHMDQTDLVTVTRTDDTAGRKTWTIQTGGADHAYLRRVISFGGPIPVGIYAMPLSLTITEK
jgi:hypothetical protein